MRKLMIDLLCVLTQHALTHADSTRFLSRLSSRNFAKRNIRDPVHGYDDALVPDIALTRNSGMTS